MNFSYQLNVTRLCPPVEQGYVHLVYETAF